MRRPKNLETLRSFVQSLKPGEIADRAPLEERLSQCWHELKLEGDEGGMDGYKLIGRMDNVVWNPPLLTFRIERHGGTVLGSVYAEMQAWTVDVENGTASCDVSAGRRVVGERDKPFDAGAAAKEIAELITSGKSDPRLERKTASKVRILIGTVVPATNLQTTTARRKRFWQALQEELAPRGWVVSKQSAVKQDSADGR
jgi:hypothetical protein